MNPTTAAHYLMTHAAVQNYANRGGNRYPHDIRGGYPPNPPRHAVPRGFPQNPPRYVVPRGFQQNPPRYVVPGRNIPIGIPLQ